MDKIKLLTIAVIALLLLNFGTLGFLLISAPKHGGRPPHRMPKEIIIERLQFDSKQQKEYQTLIDWHRRIIDSLDQQIRETKNELYTQLIKPDADTKTKDSLITLLANHQKQIEQTHFKHFEDIKNLCTPEQRENFYDLTRDLSRIFGKQPKARHE
jgi:Spy/CpxP family protein refolding chaperone